MKLVFCNFTVGDVTVHTMAEKFTVKGSIACYCQTKVSVDNCLNAQMKKIIDITGCAIPKIT